MDEPISPKSRVRAGVTGRGGWVCHCLNCGTKKKFHQQKAEVPVEVIFDYYLILSVCNKNFVENPLTNNLSLESLNLSLIVLF